MTDASRMCFLQQHVCEICGKSYAQKKVLIRHLTLHNNDLSAANHSEASLTYKSMKKDMTTGNYYSNVVSVERTFWASQVWQNIHRQSITTLYLVVYTEKPGIINKILNLEQEGEHLHAVINRIERNLTMTLNKSTRYWQVLRDYENKLYSGLK